MTLGDGGLSEKMIVGLLIAGHVHLSKIARAVGWGANNVHAAEKR